MQWFGSAVRKNKEAEMQRIVHVKWATSAEKARANNQLKDVLMAIKDLPESLQKKLFLHFLALTITSIHKPVNFR